MPPTNLQIAHLDTALKSNETVKALALRALAGDEFDLDGADKHLAGYGFSDGNTVSAAPPPACDSKCEICTKQYRPLHLQHSIYPRSYARACTDKEASGIIEAHLSGISSDHLYVQQQIEAHGNVILRRWSKLSNQQRSALLRTAMPNMYPHEHPEGHLAFDVSNNRTRRTESEKNLEKQKHRKTWLLPFLTLEALVEDPGRLLGLLHHRTTTKTSDWLMYDMERAKMAFEDCRVDISYNPHCVVMHEEAGAFGKLVPWDQEEAHRWDTVGFPRAELGFEAQHELSRFFRKMVDLVLARGPVGAAQGRAEWDVILPGGLVGDQSCQSLFAQRPFTGQPTEKLARVIDILRERQHAAEDDLWLMQTDPLYLRTKLADVEKTIVYRQSAKSDQKQQLLQAVLSVLGRCELAQRVESQTQLAITTLASLGPVVRRGQSIPIQYDTALGSLQCLLESYYRAYKSALWHEVSHAATFEKYFAPDKNGEAVFEANTESVYRKDVLFWNMTQLCAPPKYDFVFLDRSYHIGYIDSLLSSSKEKQRVDQALYDVFSDMLAINEARLATVLLLPRSTSAQKKGTLQPLSCLPSEIDASDAKMKRARDLLDSFIKLPVPTAKIDRKNLDRTIALQHAASAFWDELRMQSLAMVKQANCTAEHCAQLAQNLSAYCDESFLAGFKQQCDRMEACLTAKEDASKLNGLPTQVATEGIQPIQTSWGETPEAPKSIAQPRQKVKTRPLRGVAEIVDGTAALEIEDSAEQSRPGAISVNADSMRLYERMFNPLSRAKGAIKWDTVVAALADAGFAIAHTGGSAVTFRSRVYGSIVFHRPHPEPVLDVIMLRSMGKRLQKWFGWDAETFELRT